MLFRAFARPLFTALLRADCRVPFRHMAANWIVQLVSLLSTDAVADSG
jgi:hypothetical protein